MEKDDGAEEEGKSEKCDSRCRGSKCPWKNISSAGERSMTDDEEVDDGESAVGVCKCRDTVKEKSCGCEADDDDDSCCFSIYVCRERQRRRRESVSC